MTRVERSRPSTGSPENSPTVVVVGSGAARTLATQLDDTATIRYLSSDQKQVKQARSLGLDAHCVDVGDAGSLAPVVETADAAVVTLDSDRSTLLTAQLLRACCGIETVLATVTEPVYRDAFEGSEIQFVDAQSWLAGVVRDELSLPALGA